jgi:6-pyruvoyltetrahydropterin/6-carboxytetrahydropterin synthase
VIPAVGAEKFAEYFYHKLNEWVTKDTNGRCRVTSVEVREHEKNSAIYEV